MSQFIGFDTVVLHYRNNSDYNTVFELLHSGGIKNFIFIFDYDPRIDSISLMRYKFGQFKKSLLASVDYRIKIKCVFNLILSHGAAFNDNISRLYANRKNKTLFLTLPLFTEINYDSIALDVNHLLYKNNITIVISSFDKIIETSSLDFCKKFINNPRIALSVDMNYLFNPMKQKFFSDVLLSNSKILPSISKDISNYAGVFDSANNILNKCGKKDYYKLCSQINHSSLTLI